MEQEKKEVNERIEYYKQLERADQQKIHDKNRSFQNDLIDQIDYNAVQRQRVTFEN